MQHGKKQQVQPTTALDSGGTARGRQSVPSQKAKEALERRDLIVERRQYTATLEVKVRQQMQAIRRAHEETILRLLSASRGAARAARKRPAGAGVKLITQGALLQQQGRRGCWVWWC
jgi:precorrin-3B methylase